MRKIRVILTSIILLLSFNAYAQDIIVTTKGESIKCVVHSEGDTEVTYVKWKDKNEKLQTIPMELVWSISLDPSINRVALKSKAASASTVAAPSPSVTSFPFQTAPKVTVPQNIKNPQRKKYIWQGIGCIAGGLVGYGGFLAVGICSDSTAGLVVGIVGAVGSLIVGEVVALRRFSRASQEPKYVSLDIPVGDNLSLGVYNYALAPQMSNGAGLGFKINF